MSTPTRRLKQRKVNMPGIHVTSERQLDSGLRRAPRRWRLPSTASLTAPSARAFDALSTPDGSQVAARSSAG